MFKYFEVWTAAVDNGKKLATRNSNVERSVGTWVIASIFKDVQRPKREIWRHDDATVREPTARTNEGRANGRWVGPVRELPDDRPRVVYFKLSIVARLTDWPNCCDFGGTFTILPPNGFKMIRLIWSNEFNWFHQFCVIYDRHRTW